jgi:hypothetical protein
MAKANTRDLVRVVRTARQFFLQMARRTGCDCINGFGITMKRTGGKKTKQPAIVFYVNRKLSLRNLPVQNRIPKQINIPWEYTSDGVLEVITDVQAVRFQAFENIGPIRPCPGGFSIGHIDITAGTLSCLVKDKTNDATVILSNNHVLANTNLGTAGDPILQPGPYDGGADPKHRIATLTRFKPIDFTSGVSNYIDAAVATPISAKDVLHEIKDVGTEIPTETRDITVDDLGQFVKKSGRTTEHTTGYVDAVNATVTVKYGLFEKATFVDQIIIEQVLAEEDIAAGGDSGSGVLDNDNKLIGLLFAGSERDEGAGEPATAIINPIKHVFNLLNLETLKP